LKGRSTRRFHESTKLVAATAARAIERPRSDAFVDPPNSQTGASPIALPPDAPARVRDVVRTIEMRRSPPDFRREAIAVGELASMLRAVETRTTGDVEAYIIANDVTTLAQGLYRVAGDNLVLLREADLRAALALTCMGQSKASNAAVGVLMVGHIGAAMARDGRRAYRELLISAGEIGQRVYLAAESLGLAARNLAAYRDDSLNELLGLDGERSAVVHLTMFGRRA
jgi:SagB-type dehydrogenase family enzyme